MKIYTEEDWKLDGTFSAEEGQEIVEALYEHFFNCMPPLSLPAAYAGKCTAGFLMGEPYDCDSKGLLYMAFGKADSKYYYLGLKHAV